MKCISKKTLLFLITLFLLSFICGCGTPKTYDNVLTEVAKGAKYGIGPSSSIHTVDTFASDLVVAGTEDILNDHVDESLSVSALLLCVDDDEVLYQHNIFQKLNPASTTKILTAYTALKYGNLDDYIHVSANALNLEAGSSVAGLQRDGQIRFEDALYGLLLPSGNDAATAIAEYISGDVSSFADLMNEEALALGATSTHYVNAHGLTVDNHYTTVYDLYLMLNAALKDPTFYQVITTPLYSCTFWDADGTPIEKEWHTTNWYFRDKAWAPDGVTVLGGKTGTTVEAGSCLAMFSEANGKTYFSIVLGAPSTDILYKQMTQILDLIVS